MRGNTGEPLWTLYKPTTRCDKVWAVTGTDRNEIISEMERLIA